MVYGFGRGQGSQGSAGLGFRGSSPPWPYVGRGRGGLPRCSYNTGSRGNILIQGMTREQEIGLLKSQAENIKKELDMVESRIRDLATDK
jgi:hypothetical protein